MKDWLPTVLTIKRQDGAAEEIGQFEKVPREISIQRTRFFRVDAWENSAAKTVRAVGGLKSPAKEKRQSFFDRFVRSLGGFARSCLYFPDFSVGWIPFAVFRGIKLMRRERFSLIYTTDPPRAASVVGLILKSVFGAPWVMELMDPWYPSGRPIRRRAEQFLLSLMLRRATSVVVMTDGHAQDLHERFGLPRQRILVVPNGYDEDDFRQVVPSMIGARTELCVPGYIHLSHFGTVYPNNSGQFFPALAELFEDQPALKDRIRVHLVGSPSEETRRSASQDGLRGVVDFRGFIPSHDEVVREMYASQCLLLFWADPEFSRLAAAGKTYVYLRTGRPILAVTGQGTIRIHIENAKAGWVVNPDDKVDIKRALVEIVRRYDSSLPVPSADQDYVAQFRWDRLAEKLAGAFDGLIKYGA